MRENNIIVSVCCITYNHELYIKDCLEGFVSQKTDFNYEIIIHDDASTDKTKQIIEEYAQKFPGLFVTIFQKENQYSKGGNPFSYTFAKAKGKYIALCEGDDYWTNPNKLQKQVDFLESNNEYVLVGGKVEIHDTRNVTNKNSKEAQYFQFSGNADVKDQHLIDKHFLPFHTSTYLFKKDIFLKTYRPPFLKSMSGDIVWLHTLNSAGKIYYLDEFFGIQQHNPTGITVLHTHENSNLTFVWNRMYMWREIAQLYINKNPFLYSKTISLSDDYKKVFKSKFANKPIGFRCHFVKCNKISKSKLYAVFVETIFKSMINRVVKKQGI
jgi:glycosyltransferase involved in cell wall biosynthesis